MGVPHHHADHEVIAGDRWLLLDGQPLGEPVRMWWNFVARSQDELSDTQASVAPGPGQRDLRALSCGLHGLALVAC